MTPRAVYDCMVFVQAGANPSGPAGRCLDQAETRVVELVISDDVFAEIFDVLNRSSVQRRFRSLTPKRVADTLARIQRITVAIPRVAEVFKLTRDPRDSMYLNFAIAAGAELVVSRDNDLLDLMTANDADSMAFRTNFPTIRVLDPVAFLQTLPPTTTP